MTSITNYSTLVTAIQNVTEDDGMEFLAYIPTAISLAEDRLIRELDFNDLQEKTTGTLTIGSPTVPKPSGARYYHHMLITVGTSRKLLKFKTDDFIYDYWPDSALRGVPKYYGEDSKTNFVIAPTPDAAYTYEIKTTKKPTKLSSSNTTNYFVENIPDILFNCVMVEAAKFLKSWSQIQYWESYYVAGRDSWNHEQARRRRDDGETPQNPSGGQNTIKNNIESKSRS